MINLNLDEEIAAFRDLQPRLLSVWDALTMRDEEPHTSVVVPSLTLDQTELRKLSGASFYTSRAYRRAAETIRDTKAPVAELVLSDRIQELRGIGPGIAGRLRELVETGRIAELDELKQEVRPELAPMQPPAF